MSEDPWIRIEPASLESQIAAMRVDDQLPWDFFWARDYAGHPLLVLKHAREASTSTPLPRLRGVEITILPSGTPGENMLVFQLLDSTNREIFHQLCLDIISSCTTAPDEPAVVELALRRTWRWHFLMRSGRDRRLTLEEQKGLIGELVVIQRYLLPVLPATDVVRAWLGPTGAPKDFEIGRFCIEAKARRGAAKQYVSISSEDQLDTASVDSLYLHVVDLSPAPSDGTGMSVSDYAALVGEQIAQSAPGAVDAFEMLVISVGLRAGDDYSDELWIEGKSRVFEVTGSFPRIVPSDLLPGVANVRYSVHLDELMGYEVSTDQFMAAFARTVDGQ